MNDPARRHRLQFSVRTMLVFVALVGVDPDGEVWAVGGYVPTPGQPRSLTAKWISHDDPCTWPKSVKPAPQVTDAEDASEAYLQCRYACDLAAQ